MGSFTPKLVKPGKRQSPYAWSYSRWSKYEECPFEFYLTYVDKPAIEIVDNPKMVRGKTIHDEGDAFLKSKKAKKPPTSYAKFMKEMLELKKLKAVGEDEWAFTRDWQPTSWRDWENPPERQCWVRIKTDAHAPLKGAVLKIIDYKTGQVWGTNHEPQLELYGLGGMKLYEGIEVVQAELWYLDQKVTIPRRYLAKDEKSIQQRCEDRVGPMQEDKRFDPKPGNYCRRCNYAKSKGGPCTFG